MTNTTTPTASVPSEFAKTLAENHLHTTLTVGARRLMASVDSELNEVRGVLIQTADRNMESHGPCWCRKDLTNDAEPHNEFCLRARALMSRLGAD